MASSGERDERGRPAVEPVPALEYHRLTAHRPGRPWPPDVRLVRGFQPMAWERKPPQFKTYPGEPAIQLPADLAAGVPGQLDVAAFSRLLFLSAGVVRFLEVGGSPMWFRAAGSAGNLSPVEVYLVVGAVAGLHAGVYHYEPVEHALVHLGPAPDDTAPALVLTGVPWRTGWKYRERGLRHLWWDAGTMLANTLTVAEEAGLDPYVSLGFVDADVAALVGAQAPHELPLAIVGLGGRPSLPEPSAAGVGARGRPAFSGDLTASGTVNTPKNDLPPGAARSGHLADDPLEFPLVTAASRAGELATPAEVEAWRASARAAPPEPAADSGPAGAAAHGPGTADDAGLDLGAPVEEVVRRRGSTRHFGPGPPAPAELLRGGLAWAARPVPSDFAAGAGTLLRHDVVVHAAEGFQPGAYRWEAGPGRPGLRLVAAGELRAFAAHLTLDQALGGYGSFTVFHGADLSWVTSALGDRGYRAALLEAGVVEGRLHLAAFSRGWGATGLTFYDDEAKRFFGVDPMLVTAVGRPAYRTRPGGLPRAPVRMVSR